MKCRDFVAATLLLCCSTVVAEELSYPLVATGQVLCYDLNGEVMEMPAEGDVLYGQDANYQAGLPMSYKDNGDGTVSDLNTGLMWEQTPNAGGVTWSQAQEYCESLELGGYDDWRLPTLKELFAISDFNRGWPYIDRDYFNLSAASGVGKDEQFWADQKYVGVTVEGRDNAAFGINHGTGHIKAYPAGGSSSRGGSSSDNRTQRSEGSDSLRRSAPQQGEQAQSGQSQQRQRSSRSDGTDSLQRSNRSQPNRAEGGSTASRGGQSQNGGSSQSMGNRMQKRVRAVRGEIYGINDFVDNGDGTISDKATGLMWAKSDDGKGCEWDDALLYAESSTLAGYSDWRLPNVKELQSIVDYHYSPSSNDFKPAIDPMFNCTQIVNKAGDDDFGYYWSGTSALFRRGTPYYFAWYVAFGRAVNRSGIDSHGAGAVRFDSKVENDDIEVEGGEERYYNFVRLVRVE